MCVCVCVRVCLFKIGSGFVSVRNVELRRWLRAISDDLILAVLYVSVTMYGAECETFFRFKLKPLLL